LIDDVPNDPAQAGVVKIGPLQGEPDPDVAEISVTLHENDPEGFYETGTSILSGSWEDEVYEVEVGGTITTKRRFTANARCLLEQVALDEARSIAATLRERMESSLLNLSFQGVASGKEVVSRGVFGDGIKGEMIQAGGPGAYDFYIKLRFEVLTTRTGVTLS
jgi:hypothetical protein